MKGCRNGMCGAYDCPKCHPESAESQPNKDWEHLGDIQREAVARDRYHSEDDETNKRMNTLKNRRSR